MLQADINFSHHCRWDVGFLLKSKNETWVIYLETCWISLLIESSSIKVSRKGNYYYVFRFSWSCLSVSGASWNYCECGLLSGSTQTVAPTCCKEATRYIEHNWIPHNDTATLHMALVVGEYLDHCKIQILLYYPALAFCVFSLFSKPKKQLCGRRFTKNIAVVKAVVAILEQVDSEIFLSRTFEKWQTPLGFVFGIDYFENL